MTRIVTFGEVIKGALDVSKRLEALGPAIVRRREVRPEGDSRPVNFLSDPGA